MWQGRVLASGYGQYKDRGRVFQAHVWFWEREHGPVPEELELDHTCHTADPDCPGGPTCPHHRCVNPDHLEAVTHIENVRRSRVAKLTVGDVREIKRLFREHEGATRAFAREIAPRYGVGPQAIRSLLSGETWADVEERAA